VTEDRALEVIASYGADPARWPADERAAVLALAGRPAVAAALTDARALDALLGDWARVDVAAAPFDAAQLTPHAAPIVTTPIVPARRRGWIAAGAMAAAVAAAVGLTPMGGVTPQPDAPQVAMNSPQTTVPSATVASDPGSDADFAYVFTPTVDEDALI
jgi:hypothetical protein